MLGFITAIPAMIAGLFGTINTVTNAISNEKIALINANSEEEKIRITARLEALQSRQAVMIAEAATSKLNIRVRAGLALGPLCILSKIFIWDKTIGSIVGCAGRALHPMVSCDTFMTDPLDPNLWSVVMVVLGFYFLAEGAIGTAKAVMGR